MRASRTLLAVVGLALAASAARAQGVIETAAGGGPGDGSSALAVNLRTPQDVVRDAAGNTYIAMSDDRRVYKIATDGTIALVAGSGGSGSSGDGGPAVKAELVSPKGLAFDSDGSLLIADEGGRRVRRVDLATGTISTLIGGGSLHGRGDCRAPDHARCTPRRRRRGGRERVPGGRAPRAQARSRDRSRDHRRGDGCRRVFRRRAGRHEAAQRAARPRPRSRGQPAHRGRRQRSHPEADVLDRHALDARQRDLSARAASRPTPRERSTSAATPVRAGQRAEVSEVGLRVGLHDRATGSSYVAQMSILPGGSLLVADRDNYRARTVSPSGVATIIAGNGTIGYLGNGVPALSASMLSPTHVRADAAGNIYFYDNTNQIRRVTPAGVEVTLASTANCGSDPNSGSVRRRRAGAPWLRCGGVLGIEGRQAAQGRPRHGRHLRRHRERARAAAGHRVERVGVRVRGRPRNGNNNGTIRKVNATTGVVTVVASGLSRPQYIAVDGSDNVYFTSLNASTIQKIASGGGAAVTYATLTSAVTGLDCDAAGNLYVSDSNDQVWKIAAGTAAEVRLRGLRRRGTGRRRLRHGGATLGTERSFIRRHRSVRRRCPQLQDPARPVQPGTRGGCGLRPDRRSDVARGGDRGARRRGLERPRRRPFDLLLDGTVRQRLRADAERAPSARHSYDHAQRERRRASRPATRSPSRFRTPPGR